MKTSTNFIVIILLSASLIGCETVSLMMYAIDDKALVLPYLKNDGSECYYLDEFMPIPSQMVNGKSGSTKLRYYTYRKARFLDQPVGTIVLAFYSHDGYCWSLFEETYMR